MNITKEDIKEMVRRAFSEEFDINESDLITRKGDKTWSEHKKEFKENVSKLIQNIEDDKYLDAENVIGDTIAILNDWKKRIREGRKDNVLDEN